jgi:hypothetical protein
MNHYQISLSSNNTNGVETLSEILLFDKSVLYLSLSGLSEDKIPLNVEFSWGDGTQDIFYNDTFKNYTTDNIIPEILQGKMSKMFSHIFNHTYSPPKSTLYSTITANIDVIYPVDDILSIKIPIKIRKNDLLEDFEDFDLTNTRFVEELDREYHFSCNNDDKSFEMIAES